MYRMIGILGCLLLLTISLGISSTWSVNKVLSLDGNGDYVEVPDSESLDITSEITVELWFNADDVPPSPDKATGTLISKYDYGYDMAWCLQISQDGFWVYISNNGQISGRTTAHFASPLQPFQWYHVAFTYDGSSQLECFLNSNSLGTASHSGGIFDSSQPLKIGIYGNRNVIPFDGLIDEVRVWNIERTQEEIQSTMSTILRGDEPGLVGYWNFDDGTADDSSPYENHGTLMGDAEIIDSHLPMVNYYAVIAGVSDYPGTGNDLEYPDDDAIDIKNSLLMYENWEDDNIQLLLDSEASKSGIQEAIETMGSMADSDDVCLFFFSGHGTNGIDIAPIDEDDPYDEYICAHDENIRDDELSVWLGNLPTTNVVVIVDTCFSGGQIKIVDGFTPKVLPGTTGVVQKGDGFASDITRRIGVQDMDDNPGCVVLAACDDDELSFEFDLLENGLFSYFVVKGLEKNVDGNENGELSAEETGKYAKFIVNLLNRIFPFLRQHPQLYDDYPAGSPLSDELTVCVGEPKPVAVTHDENIEDIIGLAAPAVVVAPKSSKLWQNYANPFNPDTWIPYQLSEGADVKIRIYNVTGQLVRVLNLGHKPAGFYFSKAQAAYWDGRNEAGERVSSGVYFYQLRAGDFAAMRRMVILK